MKNKNYVSPEIIEYVNMISANAILDSSGSSEDFNYSEEAVW